MGGRLLEASGKAVSKMCRREHRIVFSIECPPNAHPGIPPYSSAVTTKVFEPPQFID